MRLALVLLLSGMAIAGGGQFYKWTDDQGHAHFSDSPPTVKPKSGYVLVNGDGLVIKRFDPAPTDAQRAAQNASSQADKEKQDQSRRDRTLVSVFSRTSEIDSMRDHDLESRQARIQADQMRLTAANKRIDALQAQAAQAQKAKKPVSEDVRKGLEDKMAEKAQIEENMRNTRQEMQGINDKAEADKKRLVELLGPSAQK